MTIFKDKKLRSEFADGFSKLFVGRHDYFWVVERFFQQGAQPWGEKQPKLKKNVDTMISNFCVIYSLAEISH